MTVGKFAVEAFGGKHSLREEAREGFVELDEPQVAHHLRPETGVEQVQHGVFDTADVLIHRAPIVVAFIHHRRVAVGRAVAHEVPRAVDERIHRVRFALSIAAALRALHVEEFRALIQGVAGTVGNEIVGENHRQILFRDGHRAALRTVDDRNRRTPVALAGNTPVAQTELRLLVA